MCSNDDRVSGALCISFHLYSRHWGHCYRYYIRDIGRMHLEWNDATQSAK